MSLTRSGAYNAGLCIICRVVPRSPGRPRCNDCHNVYACGLENVGIDSGTGKPGTIVLTLEVTENA